MNKQYHDYQVIPYSKLRRALALTLRSVQHKPMIHGLLEVDVTQARALLRDHTANTEESLSFTAFITARLKDPIESGYGLSESEAVNAASSRVVGGPARSL